MDYKEKYNKLVEAVKVLQKTNPSDEGIQNWVNDNVPELRESDDERIRKAISIYLDWLDGRKDYAPRGEYSIRDMIAWLEKQGEKNLINFYEAEQEKADFVGDGFIECHADFLDFKEGNTYWLEYIGDDKYNVRSDNLLGKTYHITPCQLYTVFKKLTWLEKQGQKSAWSEEDSMIQNGIILDSVVYELTTGFPDNACSLCGNCELHEKCMELSDGSPCYFFADSFRKVFRKVKMERKL